MARPQDIRVADLGHDTTAVLNLRTGQWVWMDQDTRRIWEASLSGGSALHTLLDTFVTRGHARRQAERAINDTVGTLRGHGLLEEHRPAWRRRRTVWQVISCR
ncbi:hypothetical protein [Streptomyces sp. CFMR 7]|uniref:hypothetical protein n=1 Tax=Streptomyces sp. CFMR 7 TaxID=1649184 RepID=UPI0011A684C8|nr:hypothetical protein [Streptomyces sp. CFMR 7]